MSIQSRFCPGCGATLLSSQTGLDHQFFASVACRDLYDSLCFYTLSLRDREFTHQLVVDAYAAQHAGPHTKAITTTFALVGLYLVAERGFTGRQVQRVHTLLAAKSQHGLQFSAPATGATLSVKDVVDVPDGGKQVAIHAWSAAVWNIWKDREAQITELVRTVLS
ncbi:MAG: hypothetical protein NVSMB52_20980 [Chloroflexota bacterium]